MSVRVRSLGLVSAATGLLLLLAPSAARAQGQVTTTTTISSSSSEHEGLGFGIKAGPLFSSIDSNIVTSPLDTRTGWIGGFFIGGNRPGVLGVQADVLYARKKVGTPTGDVTFDYLEVPVLLRVNAGGANLGGVNVYGVVGPAFDFRLKGKLNFDQSPGAQMQEIDVGVSAGAGVEISRFIIEGRYTKGLRNLGKDLTQNEKITTQSFGVMVGVRFN